MLSSRRIGVAVVAVLGMLATTAPTAAATPEPTLCRSDTTRYTPPPDVPVPACFDGRTLVLRNTLSLPIEVRGDHGGVPVVTPGADATLPGSVTSSLRPAGEGLTPPNYLIRLSIPHGATTVRIAVSPTARTYGVLSLLYEHLPLGDTLDAVRTVVQGANELSADMNTLERCLAPAQFWGDVACNAIFARDVSFAIGRLLVELGINTIKAASKATLIGALYNLVTLTNSTYNTAKDANTFLKGTTTLHIPALPAVAAPATPAQPPAPAPATTSAPAAPPAAPAERARVRAYDNYPSTGLTGRAMCRGNPDRPSSLPGGVATQHFIVGAGLASIDTALVQIDPDSRVTATATIAVNGTIRARASAAAAGDTTFTFGPVAVRADDTVTLMISFSASYGTIITVYTGGNPGGLFSASNCSIAPSVSFGGQGLRAVLTGWNT